MKRLAVALIAILALVGGGLAVTGSGPFSVAAATTPAPSFGPVPASESISADGAVVPVRSVVLAPATGGRVTGAAAEGAAVAAGDVLLALDPAQADAAITVAQAAVPIAEAQAAQAKAAVSQARQAALAADHARNQAKAGWDQARAQRDQLPSGASSASKRAADAAISGAKSAWRAATAQAKAAHAAITVASASATAAADDVKRARAAVAQAEAARAQLALTAPFAGVVSFAAWKVGEMASPGTPAVRLGDTSAWRIETTDLDETSVSRIRVGAPAELTLDAYPGRTFAGTVREIGGYGEARQGDIVYRVLLEPSAPLPDGVRWNMTASVTISTK